MGYVDSSNVFHFDHEGPQVSLVKRYHRCTCHQERYANFPSRPLNAQPFHLDDGTPASAWHVHVSRHSADCDGPHRSEYVTHPRNLEAPEDAWREHVALMVSPWEDGGTLTISDGGRTAQWQEPNEEAAGWAVETAHQCEQPWCAHQRGGVHDAYAQAAGY